ncbi:MAG: hypothetical protein KKE57_07460 [Proteobacteria bacterium]|nr:hypothetical protein [Pseudomonadota bacterium]
MKQDKEVYKKEFRKITVRTTDGATIVGKVNIGIKARVAELFTRTEDPFIVLSDVELEPGSQKVLFINKNNIVWVEPEDR